MASLSHENRLDAVLLVGLALVFGGLATVAPLEVATAMALALGALTALGRASGGVALAVTLAFAAGSARGEWTVAAYAAQAARADAALSRPLRCSFRGRVTSSPVRVRGALRWDAEIDHLVCDDGPVDWSGLVTLYGGPELLARGDEVDATAALSPPERFWNDADGDPRPHL
ncbi:MAG: hypothetical protein FWD17_12005, partial [Polyangiaceae bacterium]|nr:hypothetical protein [Polyangiaceae bacterium]